MACLLIATGWIWRDELHLWFILHRDFAALGSNDQGYREYLHRRTGIVFIYLPGGRQLLGSPETERGRSGEESLHEVRLSSFLIARSEVSQSQWKRVMEDDRSTFRGGDLPVNEVSWKDCYEYCTRTGLSLPSEAQWEYACRGGTSSPFAFGETITTEEVNFDGSFPYGGEPPGEFRFRTVAVDELAPNSFGLYHVHGNVSEWCFDWYDPDFYGSAAAQGLDPVCRRVARGDQVVVRGGNWNSRAVECRSAARGTHVWWEHSIHVGFRPVYQPR